MARAPIAERRYDHAAGNRTRPPAPVVGLLVQQPPRAYLRISVKLGSSAVADFGFGLSVGLSLESGPSPGVGRRSSATPSQLLVTGRAVARSSCWSFRRPICVRPSIADALTGILTVAGEPALNPLVDARRRYSSHVWSGRLWVCLTEGLIWFGRCVR